MVFMENDGILDYIKRRGAEVDKKINEYLTNKDSARYLGSLLGRSGYEYDSTAISRSVIEPAKYLLELGASAGGPCSCSPK